jgi:hypothetical protein
MKGYILTAAMAGAVLSAVVAMPNRVSALTITAPAGLHSAAADVNPVENVWCRWGCGWGRPYWGGYYRPYRIYRPYGYGGWGGWGWRRRW